MTGLPAIIQERNPIQCLKLLDIYVILAYKCL
jgi:hypothetical protein